MSGDKNGHFKEPYLVPPLYELRLTGRSRGRGIVEVFYCGEQILKFSLSAARFGIMAILVSAAKANAREPAESEYRDAHELSRQLYAGTRIGNSDPKLIQNIVYHLREDFDCAIGDVGKDHRRELAGLIESHHLGYRISLDPDNLRVTLIDQNGRN